jgi:dephospho-CoA kinase
VVEQRGMRAEDVRARMARQATRQQRLARADRVIDNNGTLDDLSTQVDDAWAWITALPRD